MAILDALSRRVEGNDPRVRPTAGPRRLESEGASLGSAENPNSTQTDTAFLRALDLVAPSTGSQSGVGHGRFSLRPEDKLRSSSRGSFIPSGSTSYDNPPSIGSTHQHSLGGTNSSSKSYHDLATREAALTTERMIQLLAPLSDLVAAWIAYEISRQAQEAFQGDSSRAVRAEVECNVGLCGSIFELALGEEPRHLKSPVTVKAVVDLLQEATGCSTITAELAAAELNNRIRYAVADLIVSFDVVEESSLLIDVLVDNETGKERTRSFDRSPSKLPRPSSRSMLLGREKSPFPSTHASSFTMSLAGIPVAASLSAGSLSPEEGGDATGSGAMPRASEQGQTKQEGKVGLKKADDGT